ncbi:MAG: DUF4340 domain-containing protein [Bdellovibrionaceae bacterium]|nr:DUF4340 domain-containing protein [Pseudobdellovibrionaceae bacterium]MBX3034490.1 DUF4340 domain-containing protein [Pseudobdellovibrionaceae bacterium]
MNRTLIVLLLLVGALGGYLAYDLNAEKQEKSRLEQETTLFPFPPEHVTEVLIEKNAQPVKLVRGVDGWKVEAPLRDWADNGFTDDFVERNIKEKAASIVKEGENIDWKIYGLDQPLGMITFKTQSGESRRLEVSGKTDIDKNPFARFTGENRVYTVGTAWPVNIDRGALDFRDKRLFRGKVGGIDKLTVRNSWGTFDLGNKDGQWMSPGRPAWKLDQNRVREVMSMLMQTQAQSFATEKTPTAAEQKKFGLHRPNATLTAVMPEKKWTATLALGVDGGEYAWPSEPGGVLKMEAGTVRKFVDLKLADLRDKKEAFQFDTTLAKKIEVQTPIKKVSIESADQVRQLLDRLKASTAVGYAEGPQAANFRPTSRLKVLDAQGRPVFEVAWTELVQKGTAEAPVSRRLAKTSQLDDVILLDEVTLQSWPLGEAAPPRPEEQQPQPEAAP